MKLFFLASLLSLGFGPCGSDKKSQPAPSVVGPAAAANTDGTAIPSTTAGGTPTARVSEAPTEDNQACKILQKADAEAWIGHPLDINEGRAMPVGWNCKFKTKKPFSSVTLLFYKADGDSALTKQEAAKMFGAHPVVMPGIGTKAVRSEDNNIVGVVANGKLSWLLLVSGGKDKPTAEAAEKLARAVAARM